MIKYFCDTCGQETSQDWQTECINCYHKRVEKDFNNPISRQIQEERLRCSLESMQYNISNTNALQEKINQDACNVKIETSNYLSFGDNFALGILAGALLRNNVKTEEQFKTKNEKIYKKFLRNYFYEYEYETDRIFYYPCDDLHGTFSSNGCNCVEHRYKSYLMQERIDKFIKNFKEEEN